MAHPLWFRIIKDDHRNNDGPTIPYVVGAIRVDPNAPPADGNAELWDLLQKMDGEIPKGFGLKIQGCGNKVAAHIVKAIDGGSGLDWSGAFPGEHVPDLQTLLEVFWRDYGPAISAGNYSKPGLQPFGKFTVSDLASIKGFKESETYPF